MSQYFLLLNPKLEKKVVGVLDNSNIKRGKRLYGTSSYACDFNILAKTKKPTVFLLPSPYAEEMKKQILSINPLSEIITLFL